MSFNLVFDYILKRTGIGCGAGLPALTELLARLGNPQEKYQIIHVAGTNGKGSVCALLAEIFKQHGHKTGLFISPHLSHPTERICLGGTPISTADFTHAVLAVLQEEIEELNFFEILTAAALWYFAQEGVQTVVLETGLGGRKDPTTACTPAATLITSVGLDHMEILGSTLGQIAKEKAGIIKRGVPCFCGPMSACAQEEIRRVAKHVGSPLFLVKEGEPFTQSGFDFENNYTLLRGLDGDIYPLGILGTHQAANACLAYQAARQMGVAEETILRSLSVVRFAGRFEVLPLGNSTFILDGAHNPQAAEAFVSLYTQLPPEPDTVLVCGFMKDKDYKKILQMLTPHFKEILAVCPAPGRGAQEKEILGAVAKNTPIRFYPNAARALALAKRHKRICVAGSFYLVGWVRKHLLERPRRA